jgi:hypothetical protein
MQIGYWWESQGKQPPGRPRCKWVDSIGFLDFVNECKWVHNIKLDFREIGWGGRDWIELAKDRDQWSALTNT